MKSSILLAKLTAKSTRRSSLGSFFFQLICRFVRYRIRRNSTKTPQYRFGQWSLPVYPSVRKQCLPSSAIRLKYHSTFLGKEIPCEPLSPRTIASGMSSTAPVAPASREYHAKRSSIDKLMLPALPPKGQRNRAQDRCDHHRNVNNLTKW